MYGAIEAGGTKFIVGVSLNGIDVLKTLEIKTTTPIETLNKCIVFFQENKVKTLGIGCFGPVDINKKSKTYGFITSTPKVLWQNFNIIEYLENALNKKITIDTDVNAAAYGEFMHGNHNVDSLCYMTIGTGIGIGVIVNTNLLHGNTHPEFGHMFVKIHENDKFNGVCVFHNNCLEGLASGPSVEKRWGKSGKDLENKKEVWELEAYYIAQACVNMTLAYSPDKIILGGGILNQDQLLPLIRIKTLELLNGYCSAAHVLNIDTYIVKPTLFPISGLIGAFALGGK